MDTYQFGNMITLLRKEKGLTGERLAELVGVSPQVVSKWENGRSLPETAVLPRLAEVLGVSIDSLLVPKKLIILNTVYSDGEQHFNVTQYVSNQVQGNRLSIMVNPRFLGVALDSERISVLTVKYRTPNGTFFTFAVQDELLTIDVTDKAYGGQYN